MYIIIFPLQFAVGYQRLKGKRCLFPFAFHCTGMPIMVGYTARLAWCYGTASLWQANGSMTGMLHTGVL